MSEVIERPCKKVEIVANKCPDYDKDCDDVKDHLRCWMGGEVRISNKTYVFEPVDGYCPYVFGMKP